MIRCVGCLLFAIRPAEDSLRSGPDDFDLWFYFTKRRETTMPSIFRAEVVWIVVVDGFVGRGRGLTGVFAGAIALEGCSGQERPVPELKACKL